MSGLVGHTTYGLLVARELQRRTSAVAPLLDRHRPDFLCGCYLGCDIQCMPEARCRDTGREVGFGTVPLDASPITGGPVAPWSLEHAGESYRPDVIHRLFYGRSHLVFGWKGDDVALRVPWEHLADYCSLAIRDAADTERSLAYAIGWMVHIAGDSLIKSVQPGITMRLLDGVYTPRNRILQDRFAFHVIGRELAVDWPGTFRDMAATPVEPFQCHCMRIDEPSGELARVFAAGWRPELEPLLQAVLTENRRWLPHHADDVLRSVRPDDEESRRASGGLTHDAMLALAEAAGMRRTLDVITAEAVDLIERTLERVPDWPGRR
jgi:hypothetical protein